MRNFDAAATRAALPFDRLIPALRAMFATGCEVPPRHVHELIAADGSKLTSLIMPAWLPGRFYGVKTVNIAPSNAARGQPGLHSTYTLYDANSGAPLAWIDGDQITARRTTAASALAASYLARPDASRLLVVGAGQVARLLPQAHRNVRPIKLEPGAKWELARFVFSSPVVFDCNSSLLQVFQAMDFMVLQGITGAAVYKKKLSMCNGANLAYQRNAFYEVSGFSDIDHIASGDDMLLMHKIAKQYPDRVHYLKSKEAIVATRPMTTWKNFFNQRIRWASKASSYDDKRIFGVLLLVYLVNLSFLSLLVAGCWSYYYWVYFLGLWVIKTIIELPFFVSLSRFFNKQWAIKFFFFFQPLHIFYTIIAGLLGQFGKYEWKGRRVR